MEIIGRTHTEVSEASKRHYPTEEFWGHICRNTEKDQNGEPILRVSSIPLPLLLGLLSSSQDLRSLD